ncbi:S8 family serine peptidase [Streptacidiphilus sp. 4-A2]|nr:S8 family serine peptidase [Streptacidiphilus sp. 4-A2]
MVLVLAVLLLSGAVPYISGSVRASRSYLVVARQSGPDGIPPAVAAVRGAGGRVAQVYPQIGVVLADGPGPAFAARLRADPDILDAGASHSVPLPIRQAGAWARARASAAPPPGSADRAPAAAAAIAEVPADEVPPAADPRGVPQWNLRMMGGAGADRARLRDTVVAVLDSGVDDTHPDLRSAVDPGRSASCATGSPDSAPGAWRPDPAVGESGHGTHVSGIIAADRPGQGVAGIAPGVRIAAVRLLGDVGQYYGENLVCGFLWAADHGARVINDSYFADPWKYNCPENPDQAAIIAAIGRAVRYAQDKGALVVASAGNDAQNLDAARTDDRSPNDHPDSVRPAVRRLGAECIRLPGGLPGVLDVTAVDRDGNLAGYSNWGAGQVQLAAPGGDPDGGPGQSVVSDWPGGGYAALAGTSMAAAAVSGAAAVEASLHPGAGSAELARDLEAGALRVDCPSGRLAGPDCLGGAYFGYGLVEVPRR